ncbi:hypothetical protein FPSE_02183 [Fusarium pseudograminearum CS3096]|uniref:Uncharacterized protein n=1 Tax=Fusarium pseudograminearum (strain CS3096) TaxID=1028729 RepID=K3W2I0_FUSPC|nr:hypothetical protein FPSE_02183 [Fusarium pseudograminearum CS3096]EKJ77685.1 hypothetical protein FPSE_02183 [Fusarium pseudograminearum CS3096]
MVASILVVKPVDQLLIEAYFESMSILTTHINVKFGPAFKRVVTNKQSLIAAGSAALAVDLSRQWAIGKLRNEKTFNHWFTNYYCLAHAAHLPSVRKVTVLMLP